MFPPFSSCYAVLLSAVGIVFFFYLSHVGYPSQSPLHSPYAYDTFIRFSLAFLPYVTFRKEMEVW
jgi:hypothetical protein